ncbi:hypothetical protein [Pseudomonas aeruginosa]|nr:hypothetical protein [Pseudomonas aeruginosa]
MLMEWVAGWPWNPQVGVFHNEDDAHAYRIKLEKEEELRQIGKSA